MAAAPAEDPTPSATPGFLPPAKRKKKDPSCLESSPVLPATGWSSLPGDLVRRIADSFLDTNDLDHYMYLRAVCPSWRAATDGPADNTSDPRFYPRAWIILEEVFQRDDRDNELLLLNVATGRFLRKKLPLLHDYYVVATTPSGFFVLADRSPPHAARLFSPLTGVLTPFLAPVPPEASVANVVGCTKEASLAVVLLSDSSRKIYTAISGSKGFAAKDSQQEVYNFLRKAIIGGAHAHISGSAFAVMVADLFELLRFLHQDPVKLFSSDYPGDETDSRCCVVGLGSHMVLVMNLSGLRLVFKVNTEGIGDIEGVVDIGRFAIFIGHRRCMSVDTSKFPGIEANCIYYTQHLGTSARICKYNLKDHKEEIISEAPEFLKQDKQFILVADRPFSIIHLLCSYTINIPDSQLAIQQIS